eukprot:UN20617
MVVKRRSSASTSKANAASSTLQKYQGDDFYIP